MPVTLTESDAFGASVSFPAPLDAGSVADGSPLKNFAQEIANRTRWLKNLIDGGVQKLRVVASLAALKALAAPPNGAVAIFMSGSYPRLFIFKQQASPPAQIDNYLYPADDASGYWASELWYLTSGTGSSLRLDPAVLPTPNRLVSVHSASDDTSFDILSGFNDFSAPTLSIPVLTGDKVILEGHSILTKNGAADDWLVALQIKIAGSVLDDSYARGSTESAYVPIHTSAVYTAVSNTTLSAVLRYHSIPGASGTPRFTNRHYLQALVFRP